MTTPTDKLIAYTDRVRKERDIYRAAIVDFLYSTYYGGDTYVCEKEDIKILISALGKKRMER